MSSVQSCSEEARSPRRCRRQRTVVTIFQLKYFDEKIYIILEKRCYIRFGFPFAFLSFCLCFRRKVPIFSSSFFLFFFSCWAGRGSPRTCRQRSAVKILQAQNRAAGSESQLHFEFGLNLLLLRRHLEHYLSVNIGQNYIPP